MAILLHKYRKGLVFVEYNALVVIDTAIIGEVIMTKDLVSKDNNRMSDNGICFWRERSTKLS